ncbi:MAG: LacI family transcriptional regulator [Oscillospiraceae bacterium]|jgi:ribose transport system substrate-binding protein|nr:LacI family transcriptional regulator [Oscillospiraceae bacterium]
MKKILGIVLSLVLTMSVFAGCSPSGTSSTSSSSSKGPIAIVVPSGDHGWTAALSYYAQQKCKDLGLAEGTGYKIVTSSNVNEQANQIDEMISLKASAIVLLPHTDEVSVAAQKIVTAKIPLIVFDRKVTGTYNAYVAGDNKGMGVATADYLGEKLGGKGTIAVVNTPSVGSVNVDRIAGFKEEMAAKYPNIKLIDQTEDGYTQQAGLKMATDMLVANKSIDAVYSTDDEPSLGILQAIKDAKRTDIKYVSGGGGAQAYYQKIQSETAITLFTATYSPAMIKDAIQVASDIVAGKSVNKETIIPPTIVDKSNVAQNIDANSPY